jgi:hypothetical protein
MATTFTYDIRSMLDFEDLEYRDWLHETRRLVAFPTREAALVAARKELEDILGYAGDPTIIKTWTPQPEGEIKPYSDGGVWFTDSEGGEGRVVIWEIVPVGEDADPASTFGG